MGQTPFPRSVTRYHAGIDNETRKKNQEDFIYDRVQVVIATNAFGMNIIAKALRGLTIPIHHMEAMTVALPDQINIFCCHALKLLVFGF